MLLVQIIRQMQLGEDSHPPLFVFVKFSSLVRFKTDVDIY